MRLTILAVGKLKAGPEQALYERYADRIDATGRSLGLSLALREFAEARAASAPARIGDEGKTIEAALPAGKLVVLDESGKSLPSQDFADRIARWRDGGERDLAFVIGGPDGLADSLKSRAHLRLAFGAMTWPHQLVRVMLAEQLYRAVTILSGHPYHRA